MLNRRSRRRFLLAASTLVGGSAVALVAVNVERTPGTSLLEEASQWLTSLVYELPARSAVGPLDEHARDTLVAAVVQLLEVPVEEKRYADFFSWRAEHLAGHRELYERAARKLDEVANQQGGKSYRLSDQSLRAAIAKRLLVLESGAANYESFWRALASRELFLFDRYIGRPALSFFQRTDLYVHMGYGTWPGVPTGYEAYLLYLRGQAPS